MTLVLHGAVGHHPLPNNNYDYHRPFVFCDPQGGNEDGIGRGRGASMTRTKMYPQGDLWPR